jgi:hydroxymethylbilane synthase
MLHTRPDVKIVSFRGNVATRLGRLDRGEADVTLLAAAGLERLGHADLGAPLDPATWLPAPAQGAIGIECLAARHDVLALMAAIDHAPSHAAIRAERALLAGLGGTCHSPIAVLTRHDNLSLHLSATLFSPDGSERVDGERDVPLDHPEDARALAHDLLAAASPAIRAHFQGPGLQSAG